MNGIPIAMELLSDERTLRMLHAARVSPLTIGEIGSLCGMSGAACYRRVAQLMESGLMREEEMHGPLGETLFRSLVRRIDLLLHDGLIITSIELTDSTRQVEIFDPLKGVIRRSDRLPAGHSRASLAGTVGTMDIWAS